MEMHDRLFKSQMRDNDDLQSKNMKLRDELDDVREKSVLESVTQKKIISKQTSKNTEDVKSLNAMTEKSKHATGSLNQAEEELRKVKAQLKKAQDQIYNQNKKIAGLEQENEVFRKFYSRNLGDNSQEHIAEIELVYKDLNKALKTRGNFINRGMKELSGLVKEHLSLEA